MGGKINRAILPIIAIILAGTFLAIGYSAGRIYGKERCISTVAENCLEICGVGAEFYYPDDPSSYPDTDPDADFEFLDDNADLAYLRKGG